MTAEDRARPVTACEMLSPLAGVRTSAEVNGTAIGSPVTTSGTMSPVAGVRPTAEQNGTAESEAYDCL